MYYDANVQSELISEDTTQSQHFKI